MKVVLKHHSTNPNTQSIFFLYIINFYHNSCSFLQKFSLPPEKNKSQEDGPKKNGVIHSVKENGPAVLQVDVTHF